MRDIMRLLFERDDDILSGLFGGDDADGFGMAERARRAGEWCGTTPGRRSAVRGAGSARLPRGVSRHVIDREFRDR